MYGLQLADSKFILLQLYRIEENSHSTLVHPYVWFISVGTYWICLVEGIAFATFHDIDDE